MARKSQGGSSTAEFAVLLPAVAALLALVLGAGACGMTQVRLEQAARAMARDLARGEPASSAIQTGQRAAGEAARFRTGAEGPYRTVEVSIPITLPWFGGPEVLVLTARAEARSEESGTGGTDRHAP